MTLISIARWWLIGFLFFLPFQQRIAHDIVMWSNKVPDFIRYLDEITIVIFSPLAIRELYKNRENLDAIFLIVLSPIFVLSIIGLVSGLVNGNSMFITFLGIFDYIKNFLVIFIFAAFFRKFSEVKKIFNFLFIASVLIAVIAFIQEIWAMGARHIVGNFLHEKEIYLFSNHLNNKYFWRFGIYRAPSLMEDANYLGLYCLLFLTLHMCLSKKINFIGFFSLYSGIFLSVSRVTYTGFVFIAGLQIFKGRRWLIILLIPILMLLFKMMDFPDSNIFKTVKVAESSKNTMPLRIYLRSKAIEVWNDNPILGAGLVCLGEQLLLNISLLFMKNIIFLQHLPPLTNSIHKYWQR